MQNRSLHGIVPALVTPFREDEAIDYGAWGKIIDALIASGVDGLFAIGGQGEFFALDHEERIVALRFCRQYVAGRVPLYANVGAVTTRDAVALAEQAEQEGVDYLVVVTPYYVKPNARELADHYVEICRAVTLPVLAYNIPERTGVELTPDVLRAITERCGNFVGLKDSSGNLAGIPDLLEIGNGRQWAVFMGRDHMILPALKLGCAGAVTACANVAPRLFVDLYRAFREDRLEEAARLQSLVDPLRQCFSLHTFPSVVKEAMAMAGIPAGLCRRPVSSMPREARNQLAAVLDKLREENYLPVPGRAAKAG